MICTEYLWSGLGRGKAHAYLNIKVRGIGEDYTDDEEGNPELLCSLHASNIREWAGASSTELGYARKRRYFWVCNGDRDY